LSAEDGRESGEVYGASCTSSSVHHAVLKIYIKNVVVYISLQNKYTAMLHSSTGIDIGYSYY